MVFEWDYVDRLWAVTALGLGPDIIGLLAPEGPMSLGPLKAAPLAPMEGLCGLLGVEPGIDLRLGGISQSS